MPNTTVVVHNAATGRTLHYDRTAYVGVAGARKALIAADRAAKGDNNWWDYPTDDARITESPRFLTLGDWITRHPDNPVEYSNL